MQCYSQEYEVHAPHLALPVDPSWLKKSQGVLRRSPEKVTAALISKLIQQVQNRCQQESSKKHEVSSLYGDW